MVLVTIILKIARGGGGDPTFPAALETNVCRKRVYVRGVTRDVMMAVIFTGVRNKKEHRMGVLILVE